MSPRRRRLFAPMRAVASDPEGKVLVATAFSLIAIGTVAYHFLEGWTLIDSLYFSVVTLATVGFGDLHPTTDISKLFTVGYIMAGVGIIAAFASELSKVRAAERAARREGRHDPAEAASGSGEPRG